MVYGLEGAWGYGKGDPCSPGAASEGCGAVGSLSCRCESMCAGQFV